MFRAGNSSKSKKTIIAETRHHEMSPSRYWLYGTLGFVLVALGVWRIGGGRANSTLKPAGLVIGATILTVIALSWLGVVSLDGVETCLNEKSGGRGKLIWCLGYVRKAMP